MSITKIDQENSLRYYAFTGNLEGIRAILDNPCSGFNINGTDQVGCSALFIALSQGHAAKNRDIIDLLLANGAVIENGAITIPSKTPKLLTQHANSQNLELIFEILGSKFQHAMSNSLILEIGSGDGYLKYLMSLSDAPLIKEFRSRIIETEISPSVVTKNFKNGKFTIYSGIADLVQIFGRSFFSCVISMNVIDTFSSGKLVENLRIISEVLRPGGIVMHIMSSAIHENVFLELQRRFPDQLLLPYYQEGHIGLRVIARDNPLIISRQLPQFPVQYWYELFVQNPGKFFELSNIISQSRDNLGIFNNVILFKDYFSEKIATAFKTTGFELLCQKELTSTVTVMKDEYHREFPDTNYFHNVIGTLVTDNYPLENGSTHVKEKSTFLWAVGRLG